VIKIDRVQRYDRPRKFSTITRKNSRILCVKPNPLTQGKRTPAIPIVEPFDGLSGT